MKFAQVFITKGGFKFLVNLYQMLPKNDLEKNALRTRTLTLILKLINHFFTKDIMSTLINYTNMEENAELVR